MEVSSVWYIFSAVWSDYYHFDAYSSIICFVFLRCDYLLTDMKRVNDEKYMIRSGSFLFTFVNCKYNQIITFVNTIIILLIRIILFSSRFSSKSEANASDLLENLEIFPRYCMHSDLGSSDLQSHTGVNVRRDVFLNI